MQAETCMVATFARGLRFVQALEDRGWQSGSLVTYAEFDTAASGAIDAAERRDMECRTGTHCFDCIADEVSHDLRDAVSVGDHRNTAFEQFERNCNSGA